MGYRTKSISATVCRVATIYDVAKRAGVSPATVSRSLNNLYVSPDKVESIQRAIDELEYTPNRRARSLRMKSNQVIALIIPDIENPYFTEMARGVEDVAQEAGLSVVLCNSDDDPAKEATYLDIVRAEDMAGLLLATSSGQPDLAAVRRGGRPVVAVDRVFHDDIDAVVMPNRAAGTLATTALIEAGFRRIACITGPESIDTARDRAEGWQRAMSDAGVPSDGLLYHSDFRVDGGRAAMAELLESPSRPDAVVASNNLIAVGALQELHARGLSTSGFGVSVIGSLPYVLGPTDDLSFVRLPARQMGMSAAAMLIDRINGDTQPVRTVELRADVGSRVLDIHGAAE